MATDREICFVIMPFRETTKEHTEEYWTKHFEDFLKPLIEENVNLEARRSEAIREDIRRKIVTDLVVSRVVVADLTDHNPNVYWELGVRQSFKHGTITIAETGTELPFDVSGKGTLFYNPKNHLETAEFRQQFKKAIQNCLEYPDRPDSQVLETLSGRGTLFEIFRRDEALRRLDAVLAECDINLGVLKEAIDIAQDNQKNPTKNSLITRRFRWSAADLLVTNRYINEDLTFFGRATAYVGSMNALNGQLDLWPHQSGTTESWLIKNKTFYMERIQNFKADIETARGKLSKRF